MDMQDLEGMKGGRAARRTADGWTDSVWKEGKKEEREEEREENFV